MDHILAMKIVNSPKYLLDGLGGILLRELALLANPVEELAASRQFCDNVVFILSLREWAAPNPSVALGESYSPSTRTNQRI